MSIGLTEKTPSTEQPPASEVVSLDQEFQLFDLSVTSHQQTSEGFGEPKLNPNARKPSVTEAMIKEDRKALQRALEMEKLNASLTSTPEIFRRPFLLRISGLPDLPLITEGRRASGKSNVWRRQAFTPFNPEAGYQLTDEDWRIETRIEKLRKLSQQDIKDPHVLKELAEDIKSYLTGQDPERSLPPQYLKTSEGGARIRILAGDRFFQELKEAGLADPVREGFGFEIKDEEGNSSVSKPTIITFLKPSGSAIETLERLCLYVSFPNGRQLESRVIKPIEQSFLTLTIGGYSLNGLFDYFYPSGHPLPVVNQTFWDLDKRLREISMKMCLQGGIGLELRVPPDLEKLGQIKGKFVLI